MRRHFLFLFVVVVLGQPAVADDKSAKPDDLKRFDQLIQQLGSTSFEEREQAAKALIAAGVPALPRLKAAANHSDLEVRRRVQSCIEAIEKLLPVRVPEGVTVITLPAEKFGIEFIDSKPTPKLRLRQGKVVIDAQQLYVGDARAAQLFEAIPHGMHFASTSGRRGVVTSGGITFETGKGSFVVGKDYWRPEELNSGSVYVIAPYLGFRWTEKGPKAKAVHKPAGGVTVITLPNEEFSLENVNVNGKPLMRLTYGKVVVEGTRLFLGDGKIAQGMAVTQNGMNYLRRSGEQGDFWIDGEVVYGPGTGKEVVCDGIYLRADQLKDGSVYVASPAIRFAPKDLGKK